MKVATSLTVAIAAGPMTVGATIGTRATEPCAIVSKSWASQIQATATPVVDAAVAYECLNSVPINKQGALKYIASMRPYIEWQSDTVFKKNPPSDYFWPRYDVWAAIDEIEENIQNDKYANEFAWQEDLYIKLWGPAKDGHFVNYPDVLTNAVQWRRPLALVSISDKPDGSAPVIKVYSDVISSPGNASIVEEINGQDAEQFMIDRISIASGNQDVDAAFNSLFWSKAVSAELGSNGFFQNGGRPRYVWPGNTTSFKFINGTILNLPNEALLTGNWSGVVDGPSFFKAFAPGAFATATPTSSISATPTPTPPSTSPAASSTRVPGYPKPVIISSDNSISGYYLEDEGFEDIAVLAALTFDPESPIEFQHVAQDFFAAAKAAGKKKLVVDVQANGGGYILSSYDLFRQLFPDIVQQGLGRWRENPGFLAVTKVYSKDSAHFDPTTASFDTIQEHEAVFDWRYDYNETNQPFTSYEEKFAPHVYRGDNFTNVMQWDFNDPLDTINSTFGYGTDVTGYGSRTNFTRPFASPEDIVVLLDGYCASACTIFSQFMFHQAGVKNVAMGGRASQNGLIQGVGGVKGSQELEYGDVLEYVQLALQRATNASGSDNNGSDIIKTLSAYDDYVINRSQVTSLNVKDEIYPDHLVDGLPAQYVAEYSDCRLYWTREMLLDVGEVWKAAADAAFNGAGCAFGGFGNKSTGYPTAPLSDRRATTVKAAPAPAHRDAVHHRIPEISARLKAAQFMKVVD
ncbi:hypothetical protein F5Y16DRAFT_419532 [Xylariaceae sp. FL0255]|nr:hypothetical protein F5Y16DRAFT_419532 [Xylariaceae sp. FL0255]